jgi:predicted MFS family arabinose efflux permease
MRAGHAAEARRRYGRPVLGRVLERDTPEVIRRDIGTVTAARLATNAAYRYAPPFLATIARGLDVSVAEIGVAIAITDLCGLTSPLIGRFVDRVPRRWSMAGGLLVIGVGTTVAGLSTGLILFTLGLTSVSLAKIVFDVGLGAWIADHVPFARRGRVVGITETSWALGLLVGVSLLGIVTAVWSWRVAYLVAAAGVVTMAAIVLRRLPAEPHPAGRAPVAEVGRLPASGWLAVLGMFGLMSAAQTLFITFGPWLEDEFGFSGAGLAAVTFGLGAIELAASSTSAARTDRWGKERSVIAGSALMIPAALALALVQTHLGAGLILLAAFLAAFEFAIVSALPIGAELVPGSPGRGIGTMIAFGTLGRAVMAIPVTRLYEDHGIVPAALLAAASALVAGGAMYVRLRIVRPPSRPARRARTAPG